ncbi:MAG: aminopeptidase [Anaerolineales bacterium]|nr:aminopeptidase [Anaerolineales bacterium]
MADPRLEQLARVLVNYSTAIKPRDRVGIVGSPLAAPLIRLIVRQVLRAGGYPYPLMGYDSYLAYFGFDDIFLTEASEEQLRHVSSVETMLRGDFEALIILRSRENTRNLANVDDARRVIRNRAYHPLMDVFRQRGARRELKWCGSLFPTLALAQDADMSLEDYEAFVFGGMYVDGPDATARWQAQREEQARLIEWLRGRKRVEVRGPNADLRLSIEGRTFINCCGLLNMPDGEIFTGPVEDSAEGWVRFTYPAIASGIEVDGVELSFERGRVVRATAQKNEAYLLSQIDTDAGARYLGEWAIGTNARIDRFTKDILFDEKLIGSFHMALGFGFPDTGSKNDSAIHWDMICDMRQGGQILVDGDLFYDSGAFTV